VARKNFQFEKYKREQAQQKKREEKLRVKMEKRAAGRATDPAATSAGPDETVQAAAPVSEIPKV
jgi:hypothetical protein